MAYNSYYPATYPQYYQQYPQPIYQPVQQQAPQIQQQSYQQAAQTSAPMQSSIIWVGSERDAAMYPVGPNNAVALWNQNEPVLYLKQADASGKPMMKIYDLVERPETPAESPEVKDMKSASYATKDELGAVVGVVKDFDKTIGAIRSEIENMKGDLYGLAGKKKPVTGKKVEDEA